jgi:Bacterial toxin YdaS
MVSTRKRANKPEEVKTKVRKNKKETRGRHRYTIIHEGIDDGLRLAIQAAGGRLYELAALLGMTPQAISYWKEIPLHQVVAVEKATGVSRRKLRPDLFDPRVYEKVS